VLKLRLIKRNEEIRREVRRKGRANTYSMEQSPS
jgi:hypothetical protein